MRHDKIEGYFLAFFSLRIRQRRGFALRRIGSELGELGIHRVGILGRAGGDHASVGYRRVQRLILMNSHSDGREGTWKAHHSCILLLEACMGEPVVSGTGQ